MAGLAASKTEPGLKIAVIEMEKEVTGAGKMGIAAQENPLDIFRLDFGRRYAWHGSRLPVGAICDVTDRRGEGSAANHSA